MNTENNSINTDAVKPKRAKTPANLKRAAAMRRLATCRDQDFKTLKKWQHNDTSDNGRPVGVIIDRLTELMALANEIADLYEGLPEEAMKTRKGGVKKAKFEAGEIVQVKKKHLDDYVSVCASPERLQVVTIRDSHVLVQDTAGARMFVPRKDLEPADEESDAEESDAEEAAE